MHIATSAQLNPPVQGKADRRPGRHLAFLLIGVLLVLPVMEIVAARLAHVGEAGAQAGRPSIIVVQTDDMRADDLIHAMPQTMGLLAGGNGVMFDNYIAGGTPLCCPNRATALTGKYPHNTGVLSNSGSKGGHGAFKILGNEQESIAVALDDDYFTAFIGKYLNGYPVGSDDLYTPDGWDSWRAIRMDQGYEGYFYQYYTMIENGTAIRYPRSDLDNYNTWIQTEKAVEAIEGAGSEPVFLFVNPVAPHSPAKAAPGDGKAQVNATVDTRPALFRKGVGKAKWIRNLPKMNKKLRKYVARTNVKRRRTLLAVDLMVATLYEAMPQNSYLFFLSDNGYMLGEHRIATGKIVPYKPAAEVPLLVLAKGIDAPLATGTTPALASSIDLGPTWAEIGGAEMPTADGRSLVPILQGDQPPDWQERSVLLSWSGVKGTSALAATVEGDILPPEVFGDEERTGEHRKGQRGRDRVRANAKIVVGGKTYRYVAKPYRALRGQDWLYVEWSGGPREYYDHAVDPHELTNMYGRLDQPRRDELAARVLALRACEGTAACT